MNNSCFYSKLNVDRSIRTPAGDDVETTFVCEVDPISGRKQLVESGIRSNYEKIQASLEETKIYNILRRYAYGDLSVLERGSQGVYADISQAPKNLLDAQLRLQRVEEDFMKLPVEVRAKFDHDPNVFVASVVSGDGLEILKEFDKVHQVEEPVVSDKPVEKGEVQ